MKASWKSIAGEVKLIVRRSRDTWKIIPGRLKIALGFSSLLIAGISACNTALPLLLGYLVDRIKSDVDAASPPMEIYREAAWILAAIALAYLLREGLNFSRRVLVELSCAKLQRDAYTQLLDHLIRVDLNTLNSAKVGTLHGRMSRSVDGLVRLTKLSFIEFLPAILTGVFALVAASVKQPALGLIMAGVIPIAALITIRQIISQRRIRQRLLRTSEAIDGSVVELLGGLEFVRAADTCDHEIARVTGAAKRRMAVEYGHHFQMSLYGMAKALNEGLFHILVLSTAVYYAVHGGASYGDVLTFSILYLNVMAPLNEIHRVLDEGHESSIRVGDLLDLLALPRDPSFSVASPGELTLQRGEPVIEVENLVVEYDTPSGKKFRAVDGISFTIRHGETIGVAGFSGSGKSTWLKVLLRLVHPTAGTVRLGGVPIESLDRKTIGRVIGYVSQNPFVFSGTIGENISYGTACQDPAAIRAGADAATLHVEIEEMPKGYDADVSERGSNLSGGQRQRLALARIILKRPDILILDEATSALDNVNERNVQRSLGCDTSERTTILVAHRLTTLRGADRILVFANGKIAETGTYDELIERGGVFSQLIASGKEGVRGPVSNPV